MFTLNKAMQFVRFHPRIGNKYAVTNKGLEKMADEDLGTSQQVLTLKGKLSFKFETQ